MSRAIGILEKLSLVRGKKVLAHIGGPSGAGKTELVNTLQPKVKNIRLVDLDQFDDEATKLLGWEGTPKNDYTNKMLSELHKARQDLINKFIKKSSKPIVFFGHTTEAGKETKLPTTVRILLSTNPKTAAVRRGKAKGLGKKDLSDLIKTGREDVGFMKGRGYISLNSRQVYNLILNWSKEL